VIKMSEEERVSGVGLIQNLGTEPKMMDAGDIDDLKFSVLDDNDLLFVLIADFMSINDPNIKRILKTYLKAKISVGGRGRRDAIRGEAVMKGVPPNVESEIVKPGWVERHITNRNWEEDERKRLGIEDEQKT